MKRFTYRSHFAEMEMETESNTKIRIFRMVYIPI